ncbi:MAG TPA: T9SS type A sorting domain-containing protein, partial [Flavobacteriales bacterium]|nr:T9SS type A sorting domain-containing protein [Flavobacteriales bacterium]
KGPLSVNHANGRTLKTATGESFFALGTNIGAGGSPANTPTTPAFLYRFHVDQIKISMSQLHDVGGNFMRIWLSDQIFSPEWVNLGVYDAYQVPRMCLWDDNPSSPCNNDSQWRNRRGNGQTQAYMFDEVLGHARGANIYFQVCVDPYPGIVAYEKGGWGANPYLRNFVKPYLFAQDNPNNNPYNMRRFYYQDGDTTNTTEGPFYFWKRRYKYILSRWGYSPHFAIIEPFQETGQQLSMENQVLCTNDVLTCQQANNDAYCRDMCRESRGTWVADQDLPDVLAHWTRDMIRHVRGSVDPLDPVDSPLGEDKKLFLLSGGGGPWLGDPNADQAEIDRYNRPFTIPELDLIDVHVGFSHNYKLDKGKPDWRNHQGYAEAEAYWNRFPAQNASVSARKPFNHGEFTHYTNFTRPTTSFPVFLPGFKDDIEKIHHNYNVSFHNELWSSAFTGKFAAGTSWIWDRVFWWPRSMPIPPHEYNDPAYLTNNPFGYSGTFGDTNTVNVGGLPVPVVNHKVHHHFKPLANLLSHPSWLALNFFDTTLVADAIYDSDTVDTNLLECYYLRRSGGDAAIGWVHNRKASVMNNFYITKHDTTQNFFGCVAPTDTVVVLSGFLQSTDYHITWFPTWMNSTVCPLDTVRQTNVAGELLLDLSTARFGDTIQYFMDTLRSDYAFIITLDEFVKSRTVDEDIVSEVEGDWDFNLYPNPTRQNVFLRFSNEERKEIALLDITGRSIVVRTGVTSSTHHLVIDELAKGTYFIRVSSAANARTKKLIIH